MRKEKILIVEDERIIALDLQKRLERFGFPSPQLASTGEDALEIIGEIKPDIILMDIMLSGAIDGIEAATIIKEKHNLPVIFLTAYSDEKTLDRAKKAEPFGYILKPFKEKELYTTIDIAIYKFKVDEKMKRQERWFYSLLHSVGDGIIATDKENKISFMNPMAETITGWQESQALGKLMEEIVSLVKGNDNSVITFPKLKDSPFIFKEAVLKNCKQKDISVEGSLAVIKNHQNEPEGEVLAFRDTTEMKLMSETISYQARHDILTGLINREAFSNHLARVIEAAQNLEQTHALIYLDLDRFKVVNDICGHIAGDQLLIKTTEIIKTVVRGSDICGRLGSDEFGIILEGTSKEQALFIAQRLHSRLRENKLIFDKHIFNINTTMGLVMITTQSKDIHSVLAAADDACFIAKDEGGDKIKIYDTGEDLFAKRRGEMQWISRLNKALEENRFELYYQPIASITPEEGNTTKKGELLIRMRDEKDNLVMPMDFIPSAERYNLMPAIDRWVVQNAFRYHKLLSDELGRERNPYVFSINLSAGSLADETFLDYIAYKLQEFETPADAFCFEITETAAIGNMESAGIFIKNLKQLGCTFALDDFGSGFSSLTYLKNLPVDYLKIDGAFVKDMDEDKVNRAMVQAIHSLGHTMGIKTIAEFVSSKSILMQLKEIGVNYAQGYEIGKPQPLKTLLTLYSHQV